ncbi:UNVERIFIED_CONTAM: E3 SUMO-protein ligase SIZ1 [Sesamum latifolium]|uniref:E3 SUMO-protein ligase SIZ1 n=1 Tax=Sesamum latifolium TaxID=2727402 RepID=A0AAW2Y385_9LAMI
MDLVASCKDKLAYFRIKELKDVLTQLGLSKQGKKQDLVDRILAILSDERVSGLWAKKNAVGKEDVAKLVDDTYSFWVTVAHPLYPVKLNITNVPADGSNPSQSIEKTFSLSRADRDLLSKQEYDVQAWCMLLNDKVTFRMQWPQYADLQVNGVPVRAINRPGSQLLGANGRDDGPVITQCTRDGINKIFVGGCDARIFCMGVRIAKRRSLQQVLNMIPKEDEGERFEDALARVRRCVGGGAATENADSDSDIEVVADFIPVNLRCPMSGLRMKVAGRFKHCAHMGCFDLEVFVEMNQRSRKWQCPICLKNYSLEKIIIDPYFNRITSKNCGEDVAEIEVKPDGSWRAKAEGDRKGLGELGLWHLPDGSICASVDAESKPKVELKPIKQEVGSDSNAGLKLGIKKNRNGCWEFHKPDNMLGITTANRFDENFENNGQNIIPMSSSATGSGRDCEDGSVNQVGGGNLDFSTVNGIEYESIPLNIDPTHGFSDRMTSAPAGEAEVIVLSDSEEEIEPLMSSEAGYKNTGPDTGGVPFPAAQHGIPDSYYEHPALGNVGSSCLDLYNTNDDDFGVNMWTLPSGSQGGPGFQLFGSDVDVSEALVEMQHGSLNCSSSINGYALTAETALGSAALVSDSSAQRSNTNDGLVDNPLAFSGNDPSLQIFLPTRPSDASAVPSDLRDHPDVSNGIRTKDWISLRLGDGVGAGQGEFAAASGINSAQQLQSKDDTLDSLADNASLLLGMNDNRSGKTSRERSDSPFTFPRQRRSVRPRLYLSIDSDSE